MSIATHKTMLVYGAWQKNYSNVIEHKIMLLKVDRTLWKYIQLLYFMSFS